MRTRTIAAIAAACGLLLTATVIAQTPKPKRINRAIELLEQGQPIYYTGSHSGTEGSFAQGKIDAQTYADYISYDMEHAPFDVKGLSEYMRGLVAGGPTTQGAIYSGLVRHSSLLARFRLESRWTDHRHGLDVARTPSQLARSRPGSDGSG